MQFRRLERVASWKEGNFRSLLGGLQRTGKGLLRREKQGREERPASLARGGGVSVTGDKLAERLSGEK